MIVRAYFLIFLGALELGSAPVLASDAEVVAMPPMSSEVERAAGFEVAEEARERPSENAGIFTPLSPITVESEPVRLPEDQAIE